MISLTPRQFAALEALVAHHSYQRAAHALGISVRTFDSHMQAVRRMAQSVPAATFALGAGQVRVAVNADRVAA